MDAPTWSQMAAISLMKDMRVARKALLAYLIISAVVMSVDTTGASMPRYRVRTTSRERVSPGSVPMTMRSR